MVVNDEPRARITEVPADNGGMEMVPSVADSRENTQARVDIAI